MAAEGPGEAGHRLLHAAQLAALELVQDAAGAGQGRFEDEDLMLQRRGGPPATEPGSGGLDDAPDPAVGQDLAPQLGEWFVSDLGQEDDALAGSSPRALSPDRDWLGTSVRHEGRAAIRARLDPIFELSAVVGAIPSHTPVRG